jgi:hypothetical protein
MTTDTTQNPEHDRVDARQLSFYEIDASTIDDAARKLVINYAGVAPKDVEKHIDAVVRIPPIFKGAVFADSKTRERKPSVYSHILVSECIDFST